MRCPENTLHSLHTGQTLGPAHKAPASLPGLSSLLPTSQFPSLPSYITVIVKNMRDSLLIGGFLSCCSLLDSPFPLHKYILSPCLVKSNWPLWTKIKLPFLGSLPCWYPFHGWLSSCYLGLLEFLLHCVIISWSVLSLSGLTMSSWTVGTVLLSFVSSVPRTQLVKK